MTGVWIRLCNVGQLGRNQSRWCSVIALHARAMADAIVSRQPKQFVAPPRRTPTTVQAAVDHEYRLRELADVRIEVVRPLSAIDARSAPKIPMKL